MPNGLRIENSPYTDQPPTYFDNVVIDVYWTDQWRGNVIAKLLDADDPSEVRAVMQSAVLRLDARGIFLVGSNGDWKSEDGANATRYAWKLPLSIFQNLPAGVEVREATEEEQEAALDEAVSRRVTAGELVAAPDARHPIRLTYGQPERPLASYRVGLEKSEGRIVHCFTDLEGWIQALPAGLTGLVAIHYGASRWPIQWPPVEGDRTVINVGPRRPKDLSDVKT